MSLDRSTIEYVRVESDGPGLFVWWGSSAPEGATFQVYVDGKLSWYGRSRSCAVPLPASSTDRPVWVDVGTVGGAEVRHDFSSELSAAGRGTGPVQLRWSGGTYLDPTGEDFLQGFRIYRKLDTEASETLVADLPAYPGGWTSDGHGLGGFGEGGFGRSATHYSWDPGYLPGGDWDFRVVPYNPLREESGQSRTVTVSVERPPRAPARSGDGPRLSASYSGPGVRELTLHWLPSPSEPQSGPS